MKVILLVLLLVTTAWGDDLLSLQGASTHVTLLKLDLSYPHMCEQLRDDSAVEILFNHEMVMRVPLQGRAERWEGIAPEVAEQWEAFAKPLQALVAAYCAQFEKEKGR